MEPDDPAHLDDVRSRHRLGRLRRLYRSVTDEQTLMVIERLIAEAEERIERIAQRERGG
jgi:hypothetical protein